MSEPKLHVLNGGYRENGDIEALRKAAKGSQRVSRWRVPKSAVPGDSAVINVPKFGLFAKGIVAKIPRLFDGESRYRADLKQIELLERPISLFRVRSLVPAFSWARSPQSVTTPSKEIADQLLKLVSPLFNETPSVVDKPVPEKTLDELRREALLRAKPSMTARERKTIERISSIAVKNYARKRANGRCEKCDNLAPFVGEDGKPYLEVHHIVRRSDDGPDHPDKVIALCPNCHRRADLAPDRKTFNGELLRRVSQIESALKDGKPLRGSKTVDDLFGILAGKSKVKLTIRQMDRLMAGGRA